MWINLHDDIQTLDFETDVASIAALENILGAGFRGEHVLTASRSLLRFLSALPLSVPSKSVIKGMNARVAELLALERNQSFKVSLSGTASELKGENNGHWTIPLKHFAYVALVPAHVVAENRRDAFVYALCAQHYLLAVGIKGVRINLTGSGAGGPEVAPAFQAALSDKRMFCLVVTDTDRSFPAGAECAPSRKCHGLSESAGWVGAHLPLDCRELENALPHTLLTDSIEQSDASHDLSYQLDYLKEKTFPNDDVWPWTDLKFGVKAWIRCNVNENQAERLHWQSATHCSPAYSQHVGCALEGCRKEKPKDCSCHVTPGLGEKTLDRFIEHCDKISIHKQLERARTSANFELWRSIGKVVASWGIAVERTRA